MTRARTQVLAWSHRASAQLRSGLHHVGIAHEPFDADRARMRRVRVVALLEGVTLVALVCIAVPLKHLFGIPAAVSVLGPIHGAMFLLYVWLLASTVGGDQWRRAEVARVVFAACVPFGAFLNAGFMKRKEAALGLSNIAQ